MPRPTKREYHCPACLQVTISARGRHTYAKPRVQTFCSPDCLDLILLERMKAFQRDFGNPWTQEMNRQNEVRRVNGAINSMGNTAKWVRVFPSPGTYRSRSREWVVTLDETHQIVQNFYAGALTKTLPVDAEHELKMFGALGHVEELRLNDDKSISALIRWNAQGVLALLDDRFRYISPHRSDYWEEPFSDHVFRGGVLIGVALTNKPFFKHLRLPRLSELLGEEGAKEVLIETRGV